MKDFLKEFSESELETWVERLKRKLTFYNDYTVEDDGPLTVRMDKTVISKFQEFCWIFEVDKGQLLSMLICDFLLRGEVPSPSKEPMIDIPSMLECLEAIYSRPEGEGH